MSFFSKIAFVALWLFVLSMPIEKSFEIPGFGSVGRFVLWAALSYRWSVAPDYTLERFATDVELLTVPLLIWMLCPSEGRCLALLDAYILGSIVTAGQTLQRFLSGTQTFYNRFATAGFDPNDLALTLALSLPMAYYLSLRRKPKWQWLYGVHVLAACFAIFLTASRGGTLAMAAGLSLILADARLRSDRGHAQRSQRVVARRMARFSARSLRRHRQRERIRRRVFPPSASRGILRRWRTTHFISVLVETGVVGFVLFAGLLLLMAAMAARLNWLERCFWLTMLAVWAVGVSALTWEYRKPTWFLFGILIARVQLRLQTNPAVRQFPKRSCCWRAMENCRTRSSSRFAISISRRASFSWGIAATSPTF